MKKHIPQKLVICAVTAVMLVCILTVVAIKLSKSHIYDDNEAAQTTGVQTEATPSPLFLKNDYFDYYTDSVLRDSIIWSDELPNDLFGASDWTPPVGTVEIIPKLLEYLEAHPDQYIAIEVQMNTDPHPFTGYYALLDFDISDYFPELKDDDYLSKIKAAYNEEYKRSESILELLLSRKGYSPAEAYIDDSYIESISKLPTYLEDYVNYCRSTTVEPITELCNKKMKEIEQNVWAEISNEASNGIKFEYSLAEEQRSRLKENEEYQAYLKKSYAYSLRYQRFIRNIMFSQKKAAIKRLAALGLIYYKGLDTTDSHTMIFIGKCDYFANMANNIHQYESYNIWLPPKKTH